MNIIKILNFFKEQWLGSLLIIIWVLSVLVYQNKREDLLLEAKNLNVKIEKLNNELDTYKKEVDSLKKVDTIIIERIKRIKEKEYVQIKVIDSLTISELQKFFTDRYTKKR